MDGFSISHRLSGMKGIVACFCFPLYLHDHFIQRVDSPSCDESAGVVRCRASYVVLIAGISTGGPRTQVGY